MSSRSLGTLTIDLVAKTGMFEQGMDRAARSADKRMKQIERSAKVAGAAIGGALVTGVGLVLRNSAQAEKEMAQLDAILKSTGNAAGYTRDQLVSLANQLQNKSIFSSGEIIEAETRLLSYSGVLGENIPRAMQAIIDQSARLDMSLTQSAETIGRALESPSKAAAALAQQGFGAAFTKDVRDSIDALVAAGREGEAQVRILEILEESYGGAAEAARGTLGGALSALKHTIADVTTARDGSLKGITDAVNELNRALNDPQVRQGISTVVEGFVDIASFAARAVPELVKAAQAIRDVFNATPDKANNSLSMMAQGFERNIAKLEERLKWSGNIPGLGGMDAAMLTRQRGELDRIRREMTARGVAGAFGPDRVVGPTGSPSGGVPAVLGSRGGKTRLSEEAREAERLQRTYESMMETMKERLALMGTESEVAKLLYQTQNGDLKGLDEQLKQNLISIYQQVEARQDLQEAIEKENKAREDERRRIEDGLQYGREVLADLQFELELMRMTNAERVTAIQLRGMEAEAVTEYGAAIAQANRDIEESMRQVELMDGARREFANFFEDVFSGTKSVKDAFSDMLNSIHQMIIRRISENWVEQLFGQMGSSQGGSAGGGWFQALAGIFGGPRANGGWTNPNTMYEVNERGIEMATVRGRDYLLTGNAPVEITPNHRLGRGGGGSVTQVFNNPVMSNLQTDSQRAREQARKAQREMARA